MFDGILPIYKERGMTSHDVVFKARKILKMKKIGHSGTLDPEVDGVLLLLLGGATKVSDYAMDLGKSYRAEVCLGIKTTTEDLTGEILEERTVEGIDISEIKGILKTMVGEIEQTPPIYSAVKVNGRKLYEYARQGIEIEREARPVHISSLEVEKIDETNYRMNAVVSSGTYIRTLIADFGKQLNELAIMSSLVRTKIEHLSLKDACTFEDLESSDSFLSPLQVIDPTYKIVETDQVVDIKNGKRIKLDITDPQVIFTSNGKLLAAYALQEDGLYHCLRGLF